MTDHAISDIRIRSGKLYARLSGERPDALVLLLDGVKVGEVEVRDADGAFDLQAKLPMDALSDSARVISITEGASDTVLAQVPISIGEAHADDLRSEVDLLRAELDILKRAVRRMGQSTP